MSDLKRVTSLLAGDMAAFKPKFRAAVTTDVALLDTVMRYILRRKGKQMRPMFVFLSARLHGRRVHLRGRERSQCVRGAGTEEEQG